MTARWICLLYHDITEAPAATSGGPEHFAVSAAGFARQLGVIRSEGLVGCSIECASVQAAPCVAISFDDGTEGMYARAFPALLDRSMSATFFVTTSWIGSPGYMTWPQLREMKAAGMHIQSHTRTHPFLSELGREGLRDELRGSKEELDMRLGQDTDHVALPGGDAPRGACWREIADAGYRIVGTSRWGWNGARGEVPLRVKRCTVRGEPDDEWFRRVLRGDRLLALRRHGRETLLATVRARMGPSRYARWRRRILDALGGHASEREPTTPGRG